MRHQDEENEQQATTQTIRKLKDKIVATKNPGIGFFSIYFDRRGQRHNFYLKIAPKIP